MSVVLDRLDRIEEKTYVKQHKSAPAPLPDQPSQSEPELTPHPEPLEQTDPARPLTQLERMKLKLGVLNE